MAGLNVTKNSNNDKFKLKRREAEGSLTVQIQKMLRICREEEFQEESQREFEQSEISGMAMTLRRCPSVANLNELSVVERNRLESESSILTV